MTEPMAFGWAIFATFWAVLGWAWGIVNGRLKYREGRDSGYREGYMQGNAWLPEGPKPDSGFMAILNDAMKKSAERAERIRGYEDIDSLIICGECGKRDTCWCGFDVNPDEVIIDGAANLTDEQVNAALDDTMEAGESCKCFSSKDFEGTEK